MASPGSVAPMVLISMPQMADPNFAQAVVLLCDYGADGAFGLIVNRRMTEPASGLIRTEPVLPVGDDVHLWLGGPVETTRAWVLTTYADVDGEAQPVGEGLYLSVDPALVRRALAGPPDPDVRLLIGYAGWGAGQLDAELADAAWLTAPADADLIFRTPHDEMWSAALRRLGADPATLHGGAGIH